MTDPNAKVREHYSALGLTDRIKAALGRSKIPLGRTERRRSMDRARRGLQTPQPPTVSQVR